MGLRDLTKSLIQELIKSQAPDTFPEMEDGHPVLSGFVAAGDGGSLMLTRAMERLIGEIGLLIKKNDSSLNRSYTDKEWIEFVRKQLGPILASVELTDSPDDNADLVLSQLRLNLKNNVITGIREYAFGCTLFSNDVPAFGFGHVRIETRNDWLNRKEADGGVTKVSARRVRRNWSGQRLRKRRAVVDGMREKDILDSVGRSNYVCSITLSDLGSVAGKTKAQTAARLALTAIALQWTLPSTALDGFNLLIDGNVRRQKSMVFIPGRVILSGGNIIGRPHGPRMDAVEWNRLLIERKGIFDTVGEVIEFFLSSNGNVQRPKLMNTLVQALHWFHEGCREEVDLAAIVNFAATLDALAGGRESSGILDLIKARLGPGAEDPFRPNGQSTKAAVEELYGKGRSRTIHGTNDKFGHDWSSTRRFGEALARMCLIACLELASTGLADDPNLFRR